MGAIGGALGAVGGLLGGIGAAKQQKKQNQYYQQAAGYFSPENIWGGAQTLNPYVMNAIMGNQGYAPGNQYFQSLYNIAQNPGFIDPSLRNQPFHMSAQRQNSDLQRAQSLLGRTGGGQSFAGMGNAYALANQAARTSRDVDIAQKFNLWQEQQRRTDLKGLQNAMQQGIGNAFQSAGGQGQYIAGQQAPMNAWQIGGNMIGGGLAGAAGKGGGGKGGGGGGSANPGPGMAMTFPCWVARAVYGIDDPRWLDVRYYILNIAPRWFRRLYIHFGERIARIVERHASLRLALRPLFDVFVKRGRNGRNTQSA